MEIIEAFADETVFRNEENGYTVLVVKAGKSRVSAVGIMPPIAVGEKLRGDKVAHYFTGHCTGKEAYERLKRKLGDRLGEMPAGSDFTV